MLAEIVSARELREEQRRILFGQQPGLNALGLGRHGAQHSRRPGTPGAVMRGQVKEDVKDARLARLQTLLDAQKDAFNLAQKGKTLAVLLEKPGRHEGQLVGRSPYLHSVHLKAPQSMLGSIAPARITGATPNALAGELKSEGEAAA